MDDDHEVGGGDEPPRLVEGDEHVGVHGAAEGVVPAEGDGEVAERDDGVGHDDAAPHGLLGRLLRRGRDGGLDFQHHVVRRVRERHGAQRAEHAERLPGRRGRPEPVVDGARRGSGTLDHRRAEGDHGVGEGHDGGGAGDGGDGVEVWELGEDEVRGGEDHDPEREAHVGAAAAAALADEVVELAQALPAGDHVHDVGAGHDDDLQGKDDPEAQAVAEHVLPELVVPVEALAGDHLVHLHQLPQRVERDHERHHDRHRPDTPSQLRHGEGEAQHAGADHGRHVVERRVVPLGRARRRDGQPVVEVDDGLELLLLLLLLPCLLHLDRSILFAAAGRGLM